MANVGILASKGRPTHGSDTEDDETEVVLATSARASRAARPPLPNNRDTVVLIVQELESSLQKKGLTPYTAHRQRHRGGQASSNASSSSGPAWRHMISIHSKSVDSFFRDQQHIAFLQGHSPRVTELIRIGIRYSSVRVSLVYQKSLKVAGAKMGSSQQTTRVNVHPVCAAWAAQSVAVATTLGCVGMLSSCELSDPRSSHAMRPMQMLNNSADAPFIVVATSRTPAHALPTRLVASSLLTTMKEIATSELMEELVSTAIRQPAGDALTSICKRVVHDSSAGDSIWASLALLSYLQSDPAGRRIIQQRNISDVDAAVAATFLAYGRSEITRRSRLTDLQIATDERATAGRAEQGKNRAERAEQMSRIDETIETMMHSALDAEGDESNDSMGSVVRALYNSDGEAIEGEEEESGGGGGTAVLSDRPPGRPPTTIEQQEKSRRRTPSASTALMIRGDQATDEARMVLCQKRKRGATGGFGMSPSSMILIYWDAALKSQHAHVLLMLLASSKSAAQKAADATVRSQVMERDLLSNQLLRQLSEENAVRSAVALRTTVVQSPDETPLLCAWRPNGSGVRVGIARSKDDLSSCTLYACKHSPCEPANDAQTRIACTEAYYHATPSAITAPFPGITESLAALVQHNEKVARTPCNVAIALRESTRIKENLRGTLTSMKLSGITRSVVCIHAALVVPESQLAAASQLANRMALYEGEARKTERQPDHRPLPGEVLRPLNTQNMTKDAVLEPHTTPANNLVVALEASETVRALARGRSHCGDPAKAFFGLQRPRELAESWSQDFDRPSALFPIIDVSLEITQHIDDLPCLPSRPDARLARMAVMLTLAGDAPVRAPEAVRQVHATRPYEARAMLLMAASTASLLSETVLMSCAGALNTASAAAKRVLVADLNKRLMATPYQVYLKGDRNVRPSFTGTAWEGAYGAGIDLGSSGGVGLRCSALFADKRHHGKLLVDQETADEYCEALAKRHYMKVDDTHYDSIPVEARGIPHLATPGLHSFLDECYKSTTTLRKHTHPERDKNGEFPTVDSLACLPFTPFAQALAPGTTPELDVTRQFAFRNRADQVDLDGRCFLNDNTAEDLAILREPLFPRAQITDAADNPFESADCHIDSFFNAAATVAIMIDVWLGDCGPDFEKVTQIARSFHGKRAPCRDMHVIADLMVLFNSMFPTMLGVAKPHILSAYAAAPYISHKAAKHQQENSKPVEGLRLTEMGLPTVDVNAAQAYGERFFTMVFQELFPLLKVLQKMNGTFDLSVTEIKDGSEKLDRAVRAAWFFQSPDGRLPPDSSSPLEGVASPAKVNSKHVQPRIVDRQQPDGGWEKARGALVGVTPGGYRQLLSLLVASSTMDVQAQVYRNFGGLLLRPSSAADILTQGGKQRSDKAISPLGVEGDQLAWGWRGGKLRTCKRQRRAWKANLSLIRPLCVTVSQPVPADKRMQSDDTCVGFIRSRVASHRQTGTKTSEEIESLAAFNTALAAAVGGV